MSKAKSKIKSKTNKKTTSKRKVVVTTNKQSEAVVKSTPKVKLAPTRSKRKSTSTATLQKETLLFGKQNYIWMGIGFGLIVIGLVLMSGGAMPSPDVWDEDLIFGFRRTVLAPLFMLAGLVVEVIAIFKK